MKFDLETALEKLRLQRKAQENAELNRRLAGKRFEDVFGEFCAMQGLTSKESVCEIA